MKTSVHVTIWLSIISGIILVNIAVADNPLGRYIFTADPAPLVCNGRTYVFTGRDEGQNSDWIMNDWHVLSSSDMVHWTDANFTSYLFAYFTGNSGNEEAIRFALSDNGHTFKALNKNNPIISSASISATGGVRDPHILRGENNDFYMVVTDMVSALGWDSNKGIVMLKSSNLVDWQSSKVTIPTTFSRYKKADRVWAPQVIYDREVGKYMVYFSMRLGSGDPDKIYYAYANSTFTALEAAPEVLFSNNGQSSIDGDIIYKDGMYHLFFKTEGSGNGIKSALSKKLTGGYVLYDKYLQLTSAGVEGSCIFKLINSNTYVLMYDVYTSGRYEFAISTDLKNFKKDPTPISFDFSPRHGTVIPITSEEKLRLNAKWNTTQTLTDLQKPKFPVLSCYAKGILNCVTDTDDLSVSILDLSGKLMYEQRIPKGSEKIRVGDLSRGVYMIHCKTITHDLGSTTFIVW